MIEEIKKALENYNGKWEERRSIWEFSLLIAERKVFLSKKKLTYSARIKVDESANLIQFSEMLAEIGLGFSSGGGGFDVGMSTGFGFKTETYNTLKKARQGAIEENSSLFGKKFEYKFDYKEIRSKVEKVVKSSGYKFEYQILPLR